MESTFSKINNGLLETAQQVGGGENVERLTMSKKFLEKQTNKIQGVGKTSSSRNQAVGLSMSQTADRLILF